MRDSAEKEENSGEIFDPVGSPNKNGRQPEKEATDRARVIFHKAPESARTAEFNQDPKFKTFEPCRARRPNDQTPAKLSVLRTRPTCKKQRTFPLLRAVPDFSRFSSWEGIYPNFRTPGPTAMEGQHPHQTPSLVVAIPKHPLESPRRSNTLTGPFVSVSLPEGDSQTDNSLNHPRGSIIVRFRYVCVFKERPMVSAALLFYATGPARFDRAKSYLSLNEAHL